MSLRPSIRRVFTLKQLSVLQLFIVVSMGLSCTQTDAKQDDETQTSRWATDVNSAADKEWKYSKAAPRKNFAGSKWNLKDFISHYIKVCSISDETSVRFSEQACSKLDSTREFAYQLPALSDLAMLQAKASRHGLVLSYDKEKKTLNIAPIIEAYGNKDDFWNILLSDCKTAISKETDSGKLAFRLATLLCYEEKGVNYLYELTKHSKPEIQFVALNVLVCSPKPIKADHIVLLAARSNQEVGCAAIHAMIATGDPEKVGEMLTQLATGLGEMSENELKPAIRNNLIRALSDHGPNWQPKHIPFLEAVQKVYLKDNKLGPELKNLIGHLKKQSAEAPKGQ